MAALSAPIQVNERPPQQIQMQPRHGVNWAVDGRWVSIPVGFNYPGEANAVLHGWGRGLRVTRREERERFRQERRDFLANLPAVPWQVAGEPDAWLDYVTVPCRAPVTDLQGRTVTLSSRSYLTLTNLAFARYFARNRAFKIRFGTFDGARVTFIKKWGEAVPLMDGRLHNYAGRHHSAGLTIVYDALGDGWDADPEPDDGATSQDEDGVEVAVGAAEEWREAGRPEHRTGERAHSVTP